MLKKNIGMENLTNHLIKSGYIVSEKVIKAFLNIDRADFAPCDAYSDCPQGINYGATISAPHMHAYALEELKDYLKPGFKVLDVGYGSGYLCVAFSKMMDDKGTVVGIEHIKELCDLGYSNISKSHKNLIEDNKIILKEGDGRKGCSEHAKYNCIHVGAASDTLPQDLVDQLANNGRMIIPVGKQEQYINIVDKDSDGNVSIKKSLGVRYVPLTSKEKQKNNY